MKAGIILCALGALAHGVPSWAQDSTALAELLAETASNNSDILAGEHTVRAATHVRREVTTLPNPQFTVQEFSVGSPKPFAGFTRSDFAYIGIGASQELPYPGKLRLKGEVADRAAEVQQAQLALLRVSIGEQIKTAYLRLAYLQQTLVLFESSRRTLDQVMESEMLCYRTGAGSQADVLKAELAKTKLIREITMHHQDMGEV